MACYMSNTRQDIWHCNTPTHALMENLRLYNEGGKTFSDMIQAMHNANTELLSTNSSMPDNKAGRDMQPTLVHLLQSEQELREL